MTARETQHLGVVLDADDLGLTVEGAQRAGDATPADAEQEHAAATARDQQDRCGERPPDGARERVARALERRERAVDAELDAVRDAADLDSGTRLDLAADLHGG